jgi:cyclase
MGNTRLIARLDVKGSTLIKGVHLEGLRVLGDPQEYAKRYYAEGADELIYIDIVATLYGRSKLTDIVRRTAEDVFIPMTVGGGIRSIEDVRDMLGAGADKVAINTAAVHRPDLIVEVSRRFGSQCMVLSIEAKQQAEGHWEVYTDCGRERSGLDVVEWARRGEALGAGEILLTSVDREGTRQGFDLQLTHAITSVVGIPVIASGGMGKPSDLVDVVTQGRADAVAMADVLHYGRATIGEVRQVAKSAGIQVRAYESV